jgi:hypothetical protein
MGPRVTIGLETNVSDRVIVFMPLTLQAACQDGFERNQGIERTERGQILPGGNSCRAGVARMAAAGRAW